MNLMSEQAMSNNIRHAQYRSNAITNLSDQRGFMRPTAMQQQQQMQLYLCSSNTRSSHYNDTEAEVMLKAKKMARKNLF